MIRSVKEFVEDHPKIAWLITLAWAVLFVYLFAPRYPRPMTHAEERAALGKISVQETLLQEETESLKNEMKELKEEIYMTRARQYVILDALMEYVNSNEAYTKRQIDEFIENAIKDRRAVIEAENAERQEAEAKQKKKRSSKARTKSN